jgi:hypothetical protein
VQREPGAPDGLPTGRVSTGIPLPSAAAMEIRAYAIQQRGAAATPFVYHKTLGPHDVLVRITHRSITRGDTQFIDNDWGDTQFPLVPETGVARPSSRR